MVLHAPPLSLYIHTHRTLNDSSQSPNHICLYQKTSSIMSSKVVIITSLIRRGYTTVAAERVKGQAAVKRAGVESPAAGGEKAAAVVFWMRDPKRGNWVPETHLDDVDAADLRKQLLPNNCKKVF